MAPGIQNGDETTKTPGRKNSNIGYVSSKDLQKAPPSAASPYDLPTWGQIKTLTNRAENLVSQQGLPPSPESWQCAVFRPVPPPAGPRLISNPHLFRSDQISHSVMSDSLQPQESQQARPPCPSPTPGVHSDSRPSSQ